jgi:hypothetical protein
VTSHSAASRAAAERAAAERAAQDAHAQEAQYLDACVAEAKLWLGAELTAYLAGAASPTDLDDWVTGVDAPPASAAAARLRTATEVIELFDAAGCGTEARAWLREVSVETGGHGPAQLIRTARTERELDEVRRAAVTHLKRPGPGPAAGSGKISPAAGSGKISPAAGSGKISPEFR